VASKLAPEDVLVDTNRGRATAWYRIRINLKNIAESERPPAEAPDPNYDPKSEYGEWLRTGDPDHAVPQEEGDPDDAT
jgi:hypothetical protein